MLIELLKPRRNNTPVTLPDGTQVQFNEDAFGRLVAEVANDQALLILKHSTVYAKIPTRAEAPAPVQAEEPVTTSDLESVLKPTRGPRRGK